MCITWRCLNLAKLIHIKLFFGSWETVDPIRALDSVTFNIRIVTHGWWDFLLTIFDDFIKKDAKKEKTGYIHRENMARFNSFWRRQLSWSYQKISSSSMLEGIVHQISFIYGSSFSFMSIVRILSIYFLFRIPSPVLQPFLLAQKM